MSYQIGMDRIFLRPTVRWGHTEYCSNDALKRSLGCTTTDKPTGLDFEDAWDIDLIWNTKDGDKSWDQLGRVTDMGHADFLEGGTDRRMPKPSPFTSVEKVWAFDAVSEYGLLPLRELADYFQKYHDDLQARYPNQVVTAGYYRTIMSGAIDSFGWDWLLEAAADQKKFERVLDSYFRRSLHHYRAWSMTDAPVFICHDDFVWSQGAFIQPEFYRKVIIPRYAELWKVLHQTGKKVLFCSDANWIEFLDDIVNAGADGLIFEPMMPLETVVERYGKTHVIISSKVDTRTLTFGTLKQIKQEVDATVKLVKNCPGFMFAVGNHIPSNVPVHNAQYMFNYLKQVWNCERRA